MRIRLLITALGWLGIASSCQPADTVTTTKPSKSPPASTEAQPTVEAPSRRVDSIADGRLVAAQQFVNHLDTRPPKAWSQVQRVELAESTEGGEAVYYYQHGQPQKITVQYLGETGQQCSTFYLLGNGQLVFVREQTYVYNRPITYNSAAMRANQDKEVFDLAKSTITTARSYFDHGQLLYQAGAVPSDSVAMPAYQLHEQRRLYAELRQLLARATAR